MADSVWLMDKPEITEAERERRRKISEAKRGKKRPDVAARNKTEAMRSIPRVMSQETRERMSEAKTTHGHSRSRVTGETGSKTYYVWAAMIQRCTNSAQKDYPSYGGRGIAVCERWRDFSNFLADMGEKPEGLSIDRIDNDGNYTRENCRWATPKQQRANRRDSR